MWSPAALKPLPAPTKIKLGELAQAPDRLSFSFSVSKMGEELEQWPQVGSDRNSEAEAAQYKRNRYLSL